MEIVLLKNARTRWRLVPVSSLLTTLALSLAACNDAPTAPAADDGTGTVTDFEMVPGAAVAAEAARMIGFHKLGTVSARVAAGSSFSASAGPVINSPFDLTYFGGPVLTQATSVNVYVNCASTPAGCWGSGSLTPATFLNDLNRSDFIRLVNEYTGSDARGHFPVRQMRTRVVLSAPHLASLNDIFGILFSAVSRTGVSGYSAIYHVFLPEGTAMCIQDGDCYSPDDPANWVFCAFHASVDFDAHTHVLFSVEPFQGVGGCQIPGQTPHGLIDATASTLSHELIETITDPDLDAWFNGLFGLEVADICSAFGSDNLLNGRHYFIQSEYSNQLHNCTNEVAQGLGTL